MSDNSSSESVFEEDTDFLCSQIDQTFQRIDFNSESE